jgi:homoserine dehydrogenase
MIVVVIVLVTPGPVFPLFLGAPLAEVSVFAMVLVLPAVVVDLFVRSPTVVVVVSGIIDAVVTVSRTTAGPQRRQESERQQKGTEITLVDTHIHLLLCVARNLNFVAIPQSAVAFSRINFRRTLPPRTACTGCYDDETMEQVNVGIVGLGNIGRGTAAILAETAEQIETKLGFRLRVTAICDRRIDQKKVPEALGPVFKTKDWRELVAHRDLHIIVELVGGITVAAEIVNAAIASKKSVVTANKELMALCGAEIWERAIAAGTNVAMEASVAGGIPIHAVLREGISGDRIVALYGILNGTSNYILTEMEKNGTALAAVLAEAQKLGYAEADPTNDVEGFDARSKLAILSALAFGEKITPSDIFTEGIRRLSPIDFQYAHRLGHTIRLLCAARQTEEGLILSVRPALISSSTILAGVQGSYNAIWVKGLYGEDTFYYGRGAGPRPTGVAVVSDLMRVAREIRDGSPERVSPFAHKRLGEYKPIPVIRQKRAYYLRFRVNDREGIISSLAGILAAKHISLDAVLQLPCENKHDLPFVITLEPTTEEAVQQAVEEMWRLDFLLEPPLALPIEPPL